MHTNTYCVVLEQRQETSWDTQSQRIESCSFNGAVSLAVGATCRRTPSSKASRACSLARASSSCAPTLPMVHLSRLPPPLPLPHPLSTDGALSPDSRHSFSFLVSLSLSPPLSLSLPLPLPLPLSLSLPPSLSPSPSPSPSLSPAPSWAYTTSFAPSLSRLPSPSLSPPSLSLTHVRLALPLPHLSTLPMLLPLSLVSCLPLPLSPSPVPLSLSRASCSPSSLSVYTTHVAPSLSRLLSALLFLPSPSFSLASSSAPPSSVRVCTWRLLAVCKGFSQHRPRLRGKSAKCTRMAG